MRGLLCLLSDMAAVFQSVCEIMRPQGAENSDTPTWREEEHSEAEWEWGGTRMLLFYSSVNELKNQRGHSHHLFLLEAMA